jgi:hypothetical protein
MDGQLLTRSLVEEAKEDSTPSEEQTPDLLTEDGVHEEVKEEIPIDESTASADAETKNAKEKPLAEEYVLLTDPFRSVRDGADFIFTEPLQMI